QESDDYRTVRDWILAGTPFGEPGDPRVVAIRVEPHERRMAIQGNQQLRVTARYSDGREEGVTSSARVQSNNEGLATVDAEGQVKVGAMPGAVAIMAAYMGSVDLFRAVVPRPGAVSRSALVSSDPIDAAVLGRLQQLNIEPSKTCTDAEFLRRAYLDV